MKKLAVVLTLVFAMVLSCAAVSDAGKAKGKAKGTHTSGPFIPGGSWDFES